jgi:hypothetical protein
MPCFHHTNLIDRLSLLLSLLLLLLLMMMIMMMMMIRMMRIELQSRYVCVENRYHKIPRGCRDSSIRYRKGTVAFCRRDMKRMRINVSMSMHVTAIRLHPVQRYYHPWRLNPSTVSIAMTRVFITEQRNTAQNDSATIRLV